MTNVKRAIVGAEMAGIVVGRIEVKTDGTVAIIPAREEEKTAGGKPACTPGDDIVL